MLRLEQRAVGKPHRARAVAFGPEFFQLLRILNVGEFLDQRLDGDLAHLVRISLKRSLNLRPELRVAGSLLRRWQPATTMNLMCFSGS